jgi:hypothetical protein
MVIKTKPITIFIFTGSFKNKKFEKKPSIFKFKNMDNKQNVIKKS